MYAIFLLLAYLYVIVPYINENIFNFKIDYLEKVKTFKHPIICMNQIQFLNVNFRQLFSMNWFCVVEYCLKTVFVEIVFVFLYLTMCYINMANIPITSTQMQSWKLKKETPA